MRRDLAMPVGAMFHVPCKTCTCVSGDWDCRDVPCDGMCAIYGGSNFKTFDGLKFDVYTKCQYTLLRVEGDEDVPSFHVSIDTTKCSQDNPANCLNAISLDVGEGANKTSYAITQDSTILRHGEVVSSPSSKGGILVRKLSEYYFIMDTDFGMQILWSVKSASAYVFLNPSLKGKTKGLCGTYNDSPKDDFTWFNGVVETVAARFAYACGLSTTCTDTMSTSDSCTTYSQYAQKADDICQRVKQYPFSNCQNEVEVDTYFKKCKEDVCTCYGEGYTTEECACPSYMRYAGACSLFDIAMPSWRADIEMCLEVTNCPIPGMIFNEYGNSCLMTCSDLTTKDTCARPKLPGCYCQDGLVFDDQSQKCVDSTLCPCQYKERYYQPGAERLTRCGTVVCDSGVWDTSQQNCSIPACPSHKVWSDCACEKTCEHRNPVCSEEICDGGCLCPNDMASYNDSCIDESECPCYHQGRQYQKKETTYMDCNECVCTDAGWQCENKSCPGVCKAYGDPHYTTFDGRDFEFMGECSYTFATDWCNGNKGTFKVTVENEPCGDEGFTCTRLINMTVKGDVTLTLIRGVDPIVTPPHRVKKFVFTNAGLYMYITWKAYQIALQWDRQTSLYIILPASYRGKVCGLCGDFNDNSEDDFVMPRGNMVETSAVAFADGWKKLGSCPTTTEPTDPCVINPTRKLWSEYSCALIKQSLFEPCHNKVDPQKYYENCVFDTCACNRGGDCECLCTAITAYAKECNEQGVSIPWRTSDVCGLQCEGGQVYMSCGPQCPQRCYVEGQTVVDPYFCPNTCVEGCACPAGTVLDERRGECVLEKDCQCIVNNMVFEPGQTFMRGCQLCTCDMGGYFLCSGDICTGTPDITPGTCTCIEDHTPCRDCSMCIPIGANCNGVTDCPDHSDEEFCACEYAGEKYVDGDTWQGALPCTNCTCEKGEATCRKECNIECYNGILHKHDDKHDRCCECVPENITSTGRPVPTEKPCRLSRIQVYEDCDNCFYDSDGYLFKTCARNVADCNDDEVLVFSEDHCCQCEPISSTQEPTIIFTTEACVDTFTHGDPVCCSYISGCSIPAELTGSEVCGACANNKVFNGSDCVLKSSCPCLDENMVLREPFSSWKKPGDDCAVCYCISDEIRCSSPTCEPLTCAVEKQIKEEGSCCAVCAEETTPAPRTTERTTTEAGECNELLPVDATSSVKITLDDFSGAGPVETDSVTQLDQDEYFQIAFSGRDSNVRVKVSSLTLTPSSPSGEIPSSIQISDITYYDGSFESSSSTVIPSESQIGMFPLDRLQLKPVRSFVVTVSSRGDLPPSDFTISFRGCIEIAQETTPAPRTTEQTTTEAQTTTALPTTSRTTKEVTTTGTQGPTVFTTTTIPSTAAPSTAAPTTLAQGECNELLPVDATSSVKITLDDFSGAGPVETDSVTQLDQDEYFQITFSGRDSNVRVKVSSLSITPSSPSGEIPSSIQISDITYYDGSFEPSSSTVTPSESQIGMFPLDRLQLKPVKSFVVTVSSGGLPSPSDFTISFRGCIEIEETTSAPRTTKQPTTQVGTTTGTQPTTSFTTTVIPSTAVPSTAIPTTLPPGECNEPLPVDATSSVKITLNDFSGAGPVESDSVTVDSQLDEDKPVQITFSGRDSNVRVKVSSLSITPSSPSGEIPSSIQISDITYYDGSSEPSPSTVTPSESQLGMFPLDRLQLKPVKSFVVTVSSGGLPSPSDFTISFRGCIEIEEPGTTPEQTPVFTTTPLIVSTISPTTAAPTTEVISSTAAPTTAAPTEPTTSPACRDRVGTMTRNSAFYVYELVHNVKFRLTAMAFTSEQSPLFSGTYVDVDITTDGQTWSNIVTGQHINFRSGETEEIPIPDGPLVLGIRANFVISGATDVWAIGCEEEGTTTIGQSDITTPRTRPTRPTQPTTTSVTTSAIEQTTAPECYEPQEPLQSVSLLTYEASFSQPTTITGIKLPASSFPTATTVVFRIKRVQGDEWITVLAENADSGSGDLSGSGSGDSETQGEVTITLRDSASTNLWLPSELGTVRAIQATFGTDVELGDTIQVYGCQGPTEAPTTRGTSPTEGTSPTGPATTTAVPTEATTTTEGTSSAAPSTTTAAPTQATTTAGTTTLGLSETTTPRIRTRPTTTSATTSAIEITTTPECYEPQGPLEAVSPLTYEASFSQPTTITGIKLPANSFPTTTTVTFRIKRAEEDEWITVLAESTDSGSGDLSGSGSGDSETQGEVTFTLSDTTSTNLWLSSEMGPVRAIQATFGTELSLGDAIQIYGCQGPTPAPTTRGTSPSGTSSTAPSTTTVAPTEETTAGTTTTVPHKTTAAPTEATTAPELTSTAGVTTTAAIETTIRTECYEPQGPLEAVSPLTYEASFSQPTTITGLKLPANSFPTTTTVVFRIKRAEGDEWTTVPAQSADSGSGDFSGSGSGDSDTQGEVTFALSDTASTNLWLPTELGTVRAIQATFGTELSLGDDINIYGCQGTTPAPTTRGTSPPGTSPTPRSTTTAAPTEGTTSAERTSSTPPSTTTAAPTEATTAAEGTSSPAPTTTTAAPTEATTAPECYEPQNPLVKQSYLTYEATFSQPTTLTAVKLPARDDLDGRSGTLRFQVKRVGEDVWRDVISADGSGEISGSGSGSGDSQDQGEFSFTLSAVHEQAIRLSSDIGPVMGVRTIFSEPINIETIETYGCQAPTSAPTTSAPTTSQTTTLGLSETTTGKIRTRPATTSAPGTEQTTVEILETTATPEATTATVKFTTAATEKQTTPEGTIPTIRVTTTTAPTEATISTECYEPQGPLQSVGLLTYEASFSRPTTITGIKLPANSFASATTVVFRIKRADGDEWIIVPAENADSGSGDLSGSGSGDSDNQGEITFTLSETLSTNLWLPSELGPVFAIQATFGVPLNMGNNIQVYGCQEETTSTSQTSTTAASTEATSAGTSPAVPSTTTAAPTLPTEATTSPEVTARTTTQVQPTSAPGTEQTTAVIEETTATPRATYATQTTVTYTTSTTEQPTTTPECYEPQEPLQSVSLLTYEASFSQPTTITGIKLPAISASTTTTVVFRIKRTDGDEWITVPAVSTDSGSGSGDLSGSGSGESEDQGEVTFTLSDIASTNLWLPSELGPVRAIEATFGAPLNLGNEIDVYGCQGPTPAPTTRGTSPPEITTVGHGEIKTPRTRPPRPTTTPAPGTTVVVGETSATPTVTTATQTTVIYTTQATEQPTTTPECYEPQEPLQSVSPLTYEASFSQPTTITGIKLPASSFALVTTVVFRIKRTEGDEWIIVPAESTDSGSGSGDLSGSGSGESESQGEVTFALSDSASTNLWLPSTLGPVRAIEVTFGAPLNLGNEIDVYGCQGPTPAPTTRGTSPPGTSPTAPSTTTAPTEKTTAAETTTLGQSEITSPRTRPPRPTTTTAAPTTKQTTVEILETTATPEATTATVKYTTEATEQPTTPEVTTSTIRVTTTAAPTEPTIVPECYEPQEPLQSVSPLTYEASFSQPTTITGIKLPATSAITTTTVVFRIKRAEGDEWITLNAQSADSGSGDLSGSGSGESENQGEVTFSLSDSAPTNLWLPSELGPVRAIEVTFGAPLNLGNEIDVYGCQGTTPAPTTRGTSPPGTSPTAPSTTTAPTEGTTAAETTATTATPKVTTQTTVTYTTSATEQPTTTPECYEPQEPLQAVSPLTYEASFSQPTTISGIKLPAISAGTTTTVVFRIKRTDGDEWIIVPAQSADSGSGDLSGSGSGESENQGEVTFSLSDSASTNLWLPSALGPVRAIEATFGAPLNLGNEIQVYGCQGPTPAPTTGGTSPPGTSPTAPSTTTAASTEGTTTAETTTLGLSETTTPRTRMPRPTTTAAAPTTKQTTVEILETTVTPEATTVTVKSTPAATEQPTTPEVTTSTIRVTTTSAPTEPTVIPECYEPQEPLQSVSLLTYEASFSQPTTITGIKLPAISASRITTVTFRIKRAEGDAWIIVPTENADSGSGSGDLSGSGSGDSDNQGEVSFILSDTASTNLWLPSELGTVRAIQATFGAPLSSVNIIEVYGCQGASSTAPPTTMASSTEATTAEITSPKVSTRGTTTSIPGTEQTTVVIEETTAPRRATTTTQTTVTYTTSATEQPTTAPECYEPQEPLQAVGLLTYEGSFSQPTTITGIKLPAISASTTTTVVFSIKRAEGDEWITVLAQNSDSGSGSGDFSGSGSGDSETQGEVTVALSDSASTNIWLPSTLGPVRAIQATFGAPLNLGNEIKVYGCEAVTTTAPSTTAPESTTQAICYFAPTGESYQGGESFPYGNCETCICMVGQGIECFPDSCNLDPEDCSTGETVVHTADGCCQCRAIPTTVPTTQSATTQPCLYPMVYRENCDCHRTCDDIETPCASPSSVQVCERGCFCQEGMVLADANSTDCVTKESCVTDCEYNGNVYELGETWKDSCYDCICEPDREVQCTPVCDLTCGSGEELIYPDTNECCYCAPSPTTALPTPPPPPPSKWKPLRGFSVLRVQKG
ncbi:uncharacterized protein [Diadema antillarum]|uniref:uncharacterized protein n=1 Tax=Diadema antillarum TaxID=105358 RepID=UPI003A88E278